MRAPGLAGRLGRIFRPDLPAPLAADRFKHTYRSSSQTLAKVVVAADAGGSIGDVAVPIQLVAGPTTTWPTVRSCALSERYPQVSLSVWPEAEHELPLTHPTACLAEIEHLRASLMGRPAG